MDLITVSRSLNPADAQLIRSRLEAAGFHAVVVDELAALCFEGYALGTGGIRVQVPDTEAADAKDFLESSPTTSAE